VRPATTDLLLIDEYGEVELQACYGRGGISVLIDDHAVELGAVVVDENRLVVTGALGHETVAARRDGDRVEIARNGLAINVTIMLAIDAPRSVGGMEQRGNLIDAPLHGMVSHLYVAIGDAVEVGTPVLQMEAMKLIHTLNAPVSGTVATIRCAVGDTVPAGAVLMEIALEVAEEDE
jgi:3-methylcrotonyl-CoA carboxylase alpha subunit